MASSANSRMKSLKMLVDLQLMVWQIFGPATKFLKANLVFYCFLYCAITAMARNYLQIIELILKVPSNIWRLLAATGIMLFNIKMYLCFYWTTEELRSLRLRGPKNISESVFYNYLLLVERAVRFSRNVKDSVMPTQHYNWREVEVTFLKRADPRGSTSTDDHVYFESLQRKAQKKGIVFLSYLRCAEDEVLERFCSAKEKCDRVKSLLGKVHFLERCSEKSSGILKFLAESDFYKKLSEYFTYEANFMTNCMERQRQMYFVDKVIWMWDVCYPEKIVGLVTTHILSKIRIWEDIVPKLKIFLYDLLPLTISILVIWNFTIFVLYHLFDERIIDVMQPFPDWKILLAILLVPAVLSTLLHRYWAKDELYEFRCFHRHGFLKCLIVYYMPLDDIVYRIFIAVNGIVFPSDWFEID